MIHPSYKELIEVINAELDIDEAPLVTSRYSVVLATSKRARQIIGGAKPSIRQGKKKPLSVAVEELYKGNIHIVKDGESEIEEELAFEEAKIEEKTIEEIRTQESNPGDTKDEVAEIQEEIQNEEAEQ